MEAIPQNYGKGSRNSTASSKFIENQHYNEEENDKVLRIQSTMTEEDEGELEKDEGERD
jgi:hypothetical protein